MNNKECDTFMKTIATNMKHIGILEACTNMKLHELVEGLKAGEFVIAKVTPVRFDMSGDKGEFQKYNHEIENLRGEGSI